MRWLRGKSKPSAQHERVRPVLADRAAFEAGGEARGEGAGAWLAAVAAALVGEGRAGAGDERLEDDTRALLQTQLRGHYGIEYVKIGDDHAAHEAFWSQVAATFPDDPWPQAVLADTILISGTRPEEALDLFFAAFRRAPKLLFEFGGDLWDTSRDLGGRWWRDYHLAVLRAAFADTDPTDPDEEQELAQTIAETEAEFADDPAALAAIRALVAELRGAAER